MLRGIQNLVNAVFRFFKRPEPLPHKDNTHEEWAVSQVTQFRESAEMVFADPKRLLAPAGVAILAHLLNMFSLHVLLAAFDIGPDFGASLSAFSVCLLFWIVSPSPDGIGFVEGFVAHNLTKMHVAQWPAALAAALAFRGITLYLPVVIGAFCLPRLAATVKKEEEIVA